MRKTINRGFTLIELMIVVAIIGILAAIAIPNFIRYQLRSKTAEARTVLGGIKTSQESFRAEMDNYATQGGNPAFGVRGTKTSWLDTACPAGCNRLPGGIANCTEFGCIGYKPSGDVYYEYDATSVVAVAGANPADYTASAAADLDGDTTIGGFSYGTNNLSGATTMVLAPLWAAGAPANDICAVGTAPASEVFDCAPQDF